MQNQLDRLKELVRPLAHPPVVDWNMANTVFGMGFPTDFREFIAAYGDAMWCDFIRPIRIDTSSREVCEASKGQVMEIIDAIHRNHLYVDGARANVPRWPEPGGLFPCMVDVNCDVLCWRTEGEPDDWTMVLFQEGNLFAFPCCFTQMICDWIEGHPHCSSWGVIPPERVRIGP